MARILTVVDHFTRECEGLVADHRMSGHHVVEVLDIALADRGSQPDSITVDNGSEFTSKALSDWAMDRNIRLDFIRPGKPVENAFIESFNGRLRDECLNINGFRTLRDLRTKLATYAKHYNEERPHSALEDCTPAEFAARYREVRQGDFALEKPCPASQPARQGPSVNGLTAALDKPVRMRNSGRYEGEAPEAQPSNRRGSLLRLWKKFQARQSRLGRHKP